MKFLTPSLTIASVLLFSAGARADVITLKNGEKLVGNIISDDEEQLVVEVNVTASIRDEKIIPRAEVQRIELESEDSRAFRKIQDLVPTPELLSKESYEARIEMLEGFLKNYTDSSKAGDVKQMIDILEEELMVIAQGGIKFGEGMIAPEEYAANAYGNDTRIAEKRIKEAVARMDLLVALRLSDRYEETFGESEGLPVIAALMRQVLRAYRANLSESLESFESRLLKRETGLERMTPEDRVGTELAILEENESIAKRFATEKAARVKWVTPDAFHKESIDEALRQIASEIIRLEREIPVPETPLAEVYRSAWKTISSGTDEEKMAALDDAKAKRLPEQYLLKLRERAGVITRTE